MDPTAPPTVEHGLLWSAIGALAAVCGAAFLFLWQYAEKGMGKLWKRITQQGDTVGENRAKAAETFATKADLHALGDQVDRRIDRFEASMRDLINNRGPVKTP